jgi:2-C-methyl-D-erythritol 2,4-cyclodiphosphate synthase
VAYNLNVAQAKAYRIGYGEDAHALVSGRPLVIGGVKVPSPHGPLAHSDGDVLLHALADALLSCLALGDIGQYFPPSDPEFQNLDSAVIVQRVLEHLRQQAPDPTVVNLAAVVNLDEPKLGGYRAAMQARVAGLLGLEPSRVGLTFKTSEGLSPDHIRASVSILVRAPDVDPGG